MHIILSDKTLVNNLQEIVCMLQFLEAKRDKYGAPIEPAEIRAFVHRKTGRWVFPEWAKEGMALDTKDWKPILVHEHIDPLRGALSFDVSELEESKSFKFSDLSTLARHQVSETIAILNQWAEMLQGGDSDLHTKIHVLSHAVVEWGSSQEAQESWVATWHPADRREAERILEGAPEGTFFLRKDPYAHLLEEQLSRENRAKVTCVTATYVGERGTIADLTLVHVHGKWTYYNDDPQLLGTTYSSLEEAIKAFGHVLKAPLYREAA